MQTSHHAALETKHAGLEARIREEMARPLPDNATLRDLKRRKLRVKEELALA